jgi:hypothetical protein
VVQEKLARLGADPMILTTSAFEKLVQSEVAINTKIATAAGVRAN